MNNRRNGFWIIGILLVLVQLFLFRDFSLLGRGFFFVYLYIILMAPLSISLGFLLFFALIIGWIVDLFLLSYGLHAFSAVLIAFLKFPLLRIIGFDSNQEEDLSVSIRTLKIQKFTSYVFISTLIYSFVYFILEASDSSLFPLVLVKTLFTSIITTIIFIIIESFSPSK